MFVVAGRQLETSTRRPDSHGRSPRAVRVFGALLALEVTWVHVLGQGGVSALREPGYTGWGYRALEVLGVATAAWLMTGWRGKLSWLLAAAVATGPLLGYLISRGTAVPDYSDTAGDWFEPLGITAMTAEVALLVVAGLALRRLRHPWDADDTRAGR